MLPSSSSHSLIFGFLFVVFVFYAFFSFGSCFRFQAFLLEFFINNRIIFSIYFLSTIKHGADAIYFNISEWFKSVRCRLTDLHFFLKISLVPDLLFPSRDTASQPPVRSTSYWVLCSPEKPPLSSAASTPKPRMAEMWQ